MRQVRARKKVARTVLAFVLVFAICFLPHHIFMLWFYINPSSTDEYNTFWHVLRMIGFCLYFSNSCINPIALYLVSGTFRKHFDQQLFWWLVKSPISDTNSKSGYIHRKNGTRDKERMIHETSTMTNIHLNTFKKTIENTTTTIQTYGGQETTLI